jgi:hypothetical protein
MDADSDAVMMFVLRNSPQLKTKNAPSLKILYQYREQEACTE